MERIKGAVDLLLRGLLVLLGGALLVLLGIEVFFRYVLESALSWPEEVAGMIFVWFTLVGTAYLVGENTHIAFSLISKRSPQWVKKVLGIFSQLVIIAYAAVMVVPGARYVKMFSFVTSPAANINLTWVNMAVPVSGVLIIFYSLINIYHTLTT